MNTHTHRHTHTCTRGAGEHTHAHHRMQEGKLLLNLRLHLGPIRVLTISEMDARTFLKVGILVVIIWSGITCY